MRSSEGIYIIVNIGKGKFAINTSYIESIHSSASINFNDDLTCCLPGSVGDEDKIIPVLSSKGSSPTESESSLVKHLSRVIFLSDSQLGKIVALIVDAINKVVDVSTEKERFKEINRVDVIKKIQVDNKEVEIFDIRNIFMT